MYAIHDDEDLSKTLQNNSTNNSANFKVILVDEEYRGNSLMFNLMWVLEKYALSKGYTDLCVTVDPENKYSYTNVLLSGYKYDHTQEKYGGLKRNVYVKNIEKSQREYWHYLFQLMHQEGEINYNICHCFKGDGSVITNGDIVELNGRYGYVYAGLVSLIFGKKKFIQLKNLKTIRCE